MTKIRLDTLLVENGLVESRNKAQALIMAGKVRVDGRVITKAVLYCEMEYFSKAMEDLDPSPSG